MKKELKKIGALALILALCVCMALPCLAAEQGGAPAILNAEEQAYVREHPEVSIAIDTSWIPYSFALPDNTVGGIIPNLMSLVADEVGLKVNFVGVDSYADAIATCHDGETMLVSGIANDPKMAEKNDVLLTDPYLDIGYSAVTKTETPDLFTGGGHYTAAICVGTYAKMVMQEKMPSFEFKEYKSNKECMDAVLAGETDIALVANYSVGYYSDHHEYNRLLTIQLNEFNWGLSFGVNKNADPMLIQVLNKGIVALTQEDRNQAIYAGASEASGHSNSFMDFVYDNPWIVAGSAAFVSALLVLILFLYLMRRRAAKALAAETALRKQAEEANAAKTAFLSRVSHDMRTPLNGILGLTDILKEKTTDESTLQDVEQLRLSGQYLLNLVNDTLDVSRIENGKLELHPTVCDGRKMLESVLNLSRPNMEAKHQHFVVKAENLPFTYLYIDEGRVEQVMMNLLSNAIKFTPEGGTIRFTVENLSVKDNIITDKLTVEDNGIGMSAEFLQHLFEPFSQEDNGITSATNGTGLGMPITKQILELMGGSIAAESEKGKGTKFTVNLPMNMATDEQVNRWKAQESAVYSGDELSEKRILLCEDHPLNAKIATRLLEKKGVLVELAANGKIGLDLFENSAEGYFDAILMDIRMPVMDGMTATRAIRALPRPDAAAIPIIAVTANVFDEDIKRMEEAGMNAHLGKPLDPNALYETLEKALHLQRIVKRKKILIVDDIALNRTVLKTALQADYDLLEAANGKEALAILEGTNAIDVVITDIQMPEMDGAALIRQIKAEPKYRRIAILANTQYGDPAQEDELLALGADDFVYKPSSPNVLKSRVRSVLRK